MFPSRQGRGLNADTPIRRYSVKCTPVYSVTLWLKPNFQCLIPRKKHTYSRAMLLVLIGYSPLKPLDNSVRITITDIRSVTILQPIDKQEIFLDIHNVYQVIY